MSGDGNSRQRPGHGRVIGILQPSLPAAFPAVQASGRGGSPAFPGLAGIADPATSRLYFKNILIIFCHMTMTTVDSHLPAPERGRTVSCRSGGRAHRSHPAHPGLPGHGTGAQADPPGGGEGGGDRSRDRRGRGGLPAGRDCCMQWGGSRACMEQDCSSPVYGADRSARDSAQRNRQAIAPAVVARRRRALRVRCIRALPRGMRIGGRLRDDRGSRHRPADRRADGRRRPGRGAAARYCRLACGGVGHAPVLGTAQGGPARRSACGSPGGWDRATRTGWGGRWRRGGWRSRLDCSGCSARRFPRSPCSKAARCSRRCRARDCTDCEPPARPGRRLERDPWWAALRLARRRRVAGRRGIRTDAASTNGRAAASLRRREPGAGTETRTILRRGGRD